jgi:hypothetical protein
MTPSPPISTPAPIPITVVVSRAQVLVATVFPLPFLLLVRPLLLALLAMLAVVLASDPASECASHCTESGKYEVTDQTTAGRADQTISRGASVCF